MRSVTSYFNSTLYRKSMGRFWPLWTLYGLIWLFALPLNMLNEYFDRYRSSHPVTRLLESARQVPFTLEVGVVLSCGFAVLCAMAAFGYLYNNRSACMMHALPMKRETLFTTQYLAGLSFLLLPHLVVAALTAAVEVVLLPSMYWSTALSSLGLWLLVQSGTALFFFSFAAFCAMFTGHILALPAFYGILNGLVMVIYTLIRELMAQFFYGLPRGYAGSAFVEYCTPLLTLIEACDMTASPIVVNGVTTSADRWFLGSPGTVAAYAAAGVVFAVLALMVYRYRHVESAGDVVAISIVRPIFKYGVSFCSGLCFGTLTAAFFGWQNHALPLSLSVLFWSAVGCFAAEMLLRKSFRVFRAWKGCVVMVAVMALLCFSFTMDFFGLEDKVPEADQVESLSLVAGMGYPYDDGRFRIPKITDPALIQQVIDLHRAVIRDKARANYEGLGYEPGDDYIYFTVAYTMEDGSTLERDYHSVPLYKDEIDQEGSLTWLADQMIQNRDLVALAYDFDHFETGRLVEAELENVYDAKRDAEDTLYLENASQADLERLWQAVRQDFADGTIGVRYLFNDRERLDNTYRTDLVFTWEMTDPDPTALNKTYPARLSITLTSNAARTLAWLEEMDALGEDYALLPHSGMPAASEEIPSTVEVPDSSASVEVPG